MVFYTSSSTHSGEACSISFASVAHDFERVHLSILLRETLTVVWPRPVEELGSRILT